MLADSNHKYEVDHTFDPDGKFMPSEKNIREDLEELVKARDSKIKSKFEHLKTEFEEADKKGKEKQKELDVILKAQRAREVGCLWALRVF